MCKFFLEAVENSKYGWFWECPNGKNCHYRHALPAGKLRSVIMTLFLCGLGFVLKRDQKRMDEQKEVVSLEELIEKEVCDVSYHDDGR